jgi:hypothetical protein
VHRSRVSYPPAQAVRIPGRLNRVGEVMFYGSFAQFESCIHEGSWKVGDFFAVSAWLTTQPMLFNHLGYSLEALRSKRDLPFYARIAQDSERNRLIREWEARVFTQRVPAGQEHLYRLPIALRDHALGEIVGGAPGGPQGFSGVIYPSVAAWLMGDNVAIIPSEVDAKLALFEVILLTIDSVKEMRKAEDGSPPQVTAKAYDYARPGEGWRAGVGPKEPSHATGWGRGAEACTRGTAS